MNDFDIKKDIAYYREDFDIAETAGRRALKTKFAPPPSRPPAHMGNTEVTHVVQELSLNWV